MGNSYISMKKIVTVGGGTGSYTVLKGLKQYAFEFDISAVVTMADSGGSTGRLRDEFGQLPVGDVRMALVALASDVDSHDELLRQLFLYRFDRGEGLAGHNFGNLLLTALTDILGDSNEAIKTAGRLLQVQGSVIPVTTDNVHLVAAYDTGEVVCGEHAIDAPSPQLTTARIHALSVTPKAMISDDADTALRSADVIIFGPGDLYTSVLANCVVDGFKEAVQASRAQVVYVCNLMTRAGQTVGMTAAEHVAELARYIGRMPDEVVVNTTPLPTDVVARYRAEGTHPVVYTTNVNVPYRVHAKDLLATEFIRTESGDTVVRSLIRHDSAKLAAALRAIVEG